MIVTRKFSGNAVRVSVTNLRPQYDTVGEEPAVEELLADPIIRAVMARDKVGEAELRSLILATRAALSQRGA